MNTLPLRRWLALALLALLSIPSAHAQEAAIRKSLSERLPQLPKIDEITKSPIAGLYEVRFGGNQILYADATGEYVFVNGSLIEVKTRSDLTEARIERLSAIDFGTLPLKDAIVFTQGTGARKVAVFADPNCGYCKRFERDLAAVKDVTVYTFVIPILGPDSTTKSRDIWCARDSAKSWRAWMFDGVTPPKSAASCDSAVLERNLEFAKKHRINATPVVLFEDGSRRTGAIKLEQIDLALTVARGKR